MKLFFVILAAFSIAAIWSGRALPHEIYTGIHGKNGQLCCGDDDCAATTYKLDNGQYWFLTRNDHQAGDAPASPAHWVKIPEDRITFLPIPGDRVDFPDEQHHANLCYRLALPSDRSGPKANSVFDNILFYCAFIPPGSI